MNTNTTEFGYEGDTVKLICPLRLLNGTRTTWSGPPNRTVYFHNNDKNPSVVRGERLSVIKNDSLKTYALQIENITEGVDNGSYSCDINSNPAQQHNVLLKFYSKYNVFDLLLASFGLTEPRVSIKSRIVCFLPVGLPACHFLSSPGLNKLLRSLLGFTGFDHVTN